MLTLYNHTLVPDLKGLEAHIGSPEVVLDVGAGLRPAKWANAGRHICIEPCHVYADALRDNGFEVIEARATPGLRRARGDLVLMLDVIEHMERADGQLAVTAALDVAPRLIIYTPNGFLPQTDDKWSTNQYEWQEHRSGWTPDDFPGWTIIEGKEGFAAIYG